jgi:hypothetical protein
MANWTHTLPIKHLITEDDSPENVKFVSKELHRLLEEFRLKEYPDDEELEQISDEFHTLGYVEEQPTGRWFNNVLGELYDWGDDDHRLWLGL